MLHRPIRHSFSFLFLHHLLFHPSLFITRRVAFILIMSLRIAAPTALPLLDEHLVVISEAAFLEVHRRRTDEQLEHLSDNLLPPLSILPPLVEHPPYQPSHQTIMTMMISRSVLCGERRSSFEKARTRSSASYATSRPSIVMPVI